MKNCFLGIFDYEMLWYSAETYWLDETDRSAASGASDFAMIIDFRLSLFQTPFLKKSILTFRPKPSFWVTNLQIHAVQNVPMDRTDHFGFQQKIVRIWKHVTKNTDFEICVKTCKFIGDKFCFLWRYIYIYIYQCIHTPVFLKASGCVPRWASGVFFFLKNDIFWTCTFLKKCIFLIFGCFLKNGSPGQTALPIWKVSKFCAKPRSPSVQNFHQGPIA